MKIIQRMRINNLKQRARRAYYAFHAIGDEMDCGHELAMFISSRYRGAYLAFERCKAQLKELDPTYPKGETG